MLAVLFSNIIETLLQEFAHNPLGRAPTLFTFLECLGLVLHVSQCPLNIFYLKISLRKNFCITGEIQRILVFLLKHDSSQFLANHAHLLERCRSKLMCERQVFIIFISELATSLDNSLVAHYLKFQEEIKWVEVEFHDFSKTHARHESCAKLLMLE